MGLDDLRIYNFRQGSNLPAYGSQSTLNDIRRTFWYAFADTQQGGGKPQLDLCPVESPFDLFGVEVVPIPLWHGNLPVLGFRIGRFAYCTDCNRIPEESMESLADLDTLVIDALRPHAHPTHFSLPQTLQVVANLRPQQSYFVHMGHDLDHEETESYLPPSIRLAYDGLVLEF